MKIGRQYVIYIVLVNVCIFALSLFLININTLLFIAAETLIVLSIIISVKIYRSLIRPIKMISSGIEAIKDRDFSTHLVKVNNAEIDNLIEVYNRMIDQLRHEKIIHEEQNFLLERLINASPSGIIILNLNNEIISINPAAEKLLALKEVEVNLKRINNIAHSTITEIAALKDESSRVVKLSGIKTIRIQKSYFYNRGAKHHFILIEELTEEIINTERRAYEKVIRMMSHEINNSIGAINSILNSFLNYSGQLEENDKKDYENAIHIAIDRNNLLNRFMSNLADVVRIPEPNKKSTNLEGIIDTVISLMSPVCEEKNIRLVFTRNEVKDSISLDRLQFEQVLVNVVKNSIEAIGENGEIEFETIENNKPELIIRDNGTGINKETQKQLFSPFFSSKKDGQGIGLTITREILLKHQFEFSLQTIETGITEFRILFDKH